MDFLVLVSASESQRPFAFVDFLYGKLCSASRKRCEELGGVADAIEVNCSVHDVYLSVCFGVALSHTEY